MIRYQLRIGAIGVAAALALVLQAGPAFGQVPISSKWMTVGSLHSWFSSMGCEIEVGRSADADQQDGLQWPGLYLYQDVQAAKGFWIGTANFNDGQQTYPYKVVHVGPRVQGIGAFFPMRFEMISKLAPPRVLVDGEASTSGKGAGNNAVDPNLPCDRMIINEVNTSIGLSMTRKVYAWGQQYHDNYFIYEYVFRNTGNADDDAEIEFPGKTLDSVVFFWQYRYSATKDARYVINNQTGWGINAMNDARGDGQVTTADPARPWRRSGPIYDSIRAQYTWHGRYPGFTLYVDNLGASVWAPPTSGTFSDRTDTSGRLCAPQFVGVAAIHVDRSPSDRRNDPAQPSTTTYEGSDDILNFNNNQFSTNRMAQEYGWMTRGHYNPRHADKVGVDGDPSQGFNTPNSSGGQSVANGFGPFRLAPGDSIRIVMAEAVAGLSRAKAISVGSRFKNGVKYNRPFPEGITNVQKNDSLYTGQDSLFQTFRRAIQNWQSGLAIPQPPHPPKDLNVLSQGDRVRLSWDVYTGGPTVTGWRVFRATGDYWREETLISGLLPASARSFDDTTVTRGVAAYYHVEAVGDPGENTGTGGTPAGVALTSTRYLAQSYSPARLKRQAADAPGRDQRDWISLWRIVPNPYHAGASDAMFFKQNATSAPEKNLIRFYEIPGYCTIKIFTELGELVKEIEHTDGSGDAEWRLETDARQLVVSGVYIVVVENTRTGDRSIQKLVIIR